MEKLALFAWLLFSSCLLGTGYIEANMQGDMLHKLLKSRRSGTSSTPSHSSKQEYSPSPVCIEPQDGKMEADKIDALPGQPQGVDFDRSKGWSSIVLLLC